MKFKQAVVVMTAALTAVGTAAVAHAFDGEQLSRDAKVSLEQARETALREVPGGSITDQELEHEHGGSGLRYSFDVRVGHGEREVGVDAISGKVLENSLEGPHSD